VKNTTIVLALLLAGFLGLACGQNQLDSPASTGGSPASGGVPGSGGSGGAALGSGSSAPVGGAATGGMSGTSGGGAPDAGCPPIACPAIACVAGMVPNPDDPCGCPVCQVVCSCPFVPASCPYGYQTGPAPCGCLSCAPAPSNDAGSCTWPANLTPGSDESAVGCWAHAVTGGADGGAFTCSLAEYSLDCVGAMSASTMSIPAPDSSLGCRILPLPTPSNRLYYCCPCDGATVAP